MNRKYILLLSLIGSTFFIVVGLMGLQTKGFNQRTNNAKIKIQTIEDKIKINHGMNSSCESFTNQACRTSDKPEILIWGDSYAMHLTEGILSSNPKAKIIQITKSVCGPIFDLAPIYLPDYPLNWAVGCLTFNQDVKNWLKQNNTVKYVVLSSPFLQYLSESSSLLLNKREIKHADINLLAMHIENTLSEIKSMGITPVIFTPPPANGTDLGACLARSTWLGYDINRCDFKTSDFPEHRVKVYSLLKKISKRYHVVQLEELLCHNDYCQSHIGSTFLYMDSGHLSREGSSTIGKLNNFYRMITNNSTKQP
ncbi:MAG TPA: hypothetical protein ENJ41_06285 [Oceanospirillales bacterium]|nr:hypothetical protein [Oceanospirillales bacterium]